jgi:hypothetical protein
MQPLKPGPDHRFAAVPAGRLASYTFSKDATLASYQIVKDRLATLVANSVTCYRVCSFKPFAGLESLTTGLPMDRGRQGSVTLLDGDALPASGHSRWCSTDEFHQRNPFGGIAEYSGPRGPCQMLCEVDSTWIRPVGKGQFSLKFARIEKCGNRVKLGNHSADHPSLLPEVRLDPPPCHPRHDAAGDAHWQ